MYCDTDLPCPAAALSRRAFSLFDSLSSTRSVFGSRFFAPAFAGPLNPLLLHTLGTATVGENPDFFRVVNLIRKSSVKLLPNVFSGNARRGGGKKSRQLPHRRLLPYATALIWTRITPRSVSMR